jgi:hypothetical protein
MKIYLLPASFSHFFASDFLLVGGAKPEKAADCAYASGVSVDDDARDVARVLVGGARLEKAADCAYASSGVREVVLKEAFCDEAK